MKALNLLSAAARLFGRIKADGDKISEVAIFESRARGQSGLHCSGKGVDNLPVKWTNVVVPSCTDLELAGRSIFNTTIGATGMTAHLPRIHAGKIQDLPFLINLAPRGAQSSWSL